MKKYKPTYLGRLMGKERDKWLSNQYPKFEEYYDALKDYSEQISDVIPIESSESFKVQLIAEKEVFDDLQIKNSKIIIEGNILSI